jgi:hypothetical protein
VFALSQVYRPGVTLCVILWAFYIMAKKNGYELSRRWFDFAFENKEAKTTHTAIFMWIVELNNRLGWKEEFGLPTGETMDGLSIGNKNTYSSAINDLVKWKFIEIVRDSKNQYESRVIRICRDESEPALIRPLDRALLRHSTGHRSGIAPGTVPIDKQQTSKPVNQEQQTIIPEGEPPVSSEPDSSQMPKSEKPKRKVAPKEKGDTTPPGLTEQFVEPYDKFLRFHTSAGEKVTPGGRKALKEIIHHLLKIASENRGNGHESDEDRAVDIWRIILDRHQNWDKFHQGQLKLEQINSNLVNIMASIKSQKQNGKQLDAEQLAAQAMHHFNTQGN